MKSREAIVECECECGARFERPGAVYGLWDSFRLKYHWWDKLQFWSRSTFMELTGYPEEHGMHLNKGWKVKRFDRQCDWRGKCMRRPYAEVFVLSMKGPDEERYCPADKWRFSGSWSHLCWWHFQYERVRFWFLRRMGVNRYLGWGYAETEKEYYKRLKEEEEDEGEDEEVSKSDHAG